MSFWNQFYDSIAHSSLLDIVAAVSALTGVFFIVLSGIGILRMKDVYLRSQTSTLAPTLGKIGIMIALAARFPDAAVAAKAVLVILFLFISAPVAAHLIMRSAYLDKAKMCDSAVRDDYSEYKK